MQQIDVASVRLSCGGVEIAAQLTPTTVGDYDRDGVADRMVKFDRAPVLAALAGKAGDVTLTVSGRLADGSRFSGTGTVKVIGADK